MLRIQPNEALYLKSWAKEPGLDHVLKPMVMDMKYSTTFPGAYVADAYERMFLNAAKGDNSLFVSEVCSVAATAAVRFLFLCSSVSLLGFCPATAT